MDAETARSFTAPDPALKGRHLLPRENRQSLVGQSEGYIVRIALVGANGQSDVLSRCLAGRRL